MRVKFVLFGLCALTALTSLVAVVSHNQMSISHDQVEALGDRMHQQDRTLYDLRDENALLKQRIERLKENNITQNQAMNRLSERIDLLENPPKRKAQKPK